MKGFGKEVRDGLHEGGCEFVRHGKGDHDIWRNPRTGKSVTVPVKIMSRHLATRF
jgi:predicted RNA binding protein YcfA (HicA-like mRNA interferase family)